MSKTDIREIVTDALRYWEPLRLIYNLLLLAITLACLAPALRSSRASINPMEQIPTLLLLAVIANILYCAAYVPDVFVQISLFRPQWRRWRWLLFVFGCLMAAFFTYEIAEWLALSIETSGW